jgi:hypothetical protein
VLVLAKVVANARGLNDDCPSPSLRTVLQVPRHV